MKKTSMLLFLAVLTISSCGTVAQWGAVDNGQNFQDGIYSNSPSFRSKEEKEKSKSETDALIAKTKESPIYLFGDKKDTVMIPENFSARIQYDQKVGGTVVTVGENPYDWRWDLENRYGYYYGPYSLGSSWYWSRHYDPFWNPYWYSWGYSPWRYYSYYDPWYYGGFYDPWYYGGWYGGYYGGWYNPWYYTGYWGWHDPWHHHHHGWYDPHHHGWYDPHHHGPSHIGGSPHHSDRYYGLRANTERRGSVSEGGKSGTIRTNGGTIRGGMSIGNTRSRSASTVRRTNGTVSRPASATRPSSASSVSASRSATMTRSATGANYRRPSSSSSQSTVTRDQSGYSRSSSYGSSSSSYERSSSSSGYNRSSSSYSRSSGYGGSSSGSSGYSRGSSGSSSHSRGSSGGYRR